MSTLLNSDLVIAINAAGRKVAFGRIDRSFNSGVSELELNTDAAGEHLLISGFRTLLAHLKATRPEKTSIAFILPGITASKFLTAWGARNRGIDPFAGVHVKGTKDLQVLQAWMPEAYREELKAAVDEAFDGFLDICFVNDDAITQDAETQEWGYHYLNKDGQEVVARGAYIGSVGELIAAVKELTPAPKAVKPAMISGLEDL